jgi:DNA repair exonuclease SbcCD ATPase subunit
MKKPYCPVCWVDPSRHSDLYCDIIDQAKAELKEMKQKADDREADIRDFKKERDEWKQACQPIAKRIRELSEKITLRDVQIIDLTVERDSLKSMYKSSQDINAGLLKEHNEFKAAYEKLAWASHPTPAELLTSQMSKLISSMNDAGAAAIRPAPGRLEIAAMMLAGRAADPDLSATREQCIGESILMATTLIKTEKETK